MKLITIFVYKRSAIYTSNYLFQFPERFQRMISQFFSDLTNLCLISCTDGPASLERIVLHRLEAISGDVSMIIRVSNLNPCY